MMVRTDIASGQTVGRWDGGTVGTGSTGSNSLPQFQHSSFRWLA
jgi:hypothetical protein